MRSGRVEFVLSLLILGCARSNSIPDSGRGANAASADAAASVALDSGISMSEKDAAASVGVSDSAAGSATPTLDASVAASSGPTTVREDAGEHPADATLDVGAAPSEAPSLTAPSVPPTAAAAPSRQDPFSLPEKCTSGQFWTEGSGETMRPGEACIACHEREDRGPVLTFAGTVYARGHEPDDCLGVLPADGIVVEITDATNQVFKLSTNTAGNFLRSASVVLPYTARVLSTQGERRMLTPQTNGDCNSCHTSAGSNGAPGRIAIP
jgi:hypothetical protein